LNFQGAERDQFLELLEQFADFFGSISCLPAQIIESPAADRQCGA
jgi:hypothetical protein